VLLVFGADPVGNGLSGSPAAAEVSAAGTVIVFDAFLTKTAEAADAVFPMPTFAEKDGTFVSATGLEQKLQKAMVPPAGVAQLWESFDVIAEESGRSLSFAPSMEEKEGGERAPEAVSPAGDVALPGPGEKRVVLRGVPVADHRLLQVEETGVLLPGAVVEINPADLGGLGIDDGETVAVISGGARLERKVRGDLKVPPGQVHLPFDGASGDDVAFAAAAERPAGWPAVERRLDGIEKVGGEGA
jgi:predicted molibdopterin-dependent oxidoreductase YjgC